MNNEVRTYLSEVENSLGIELYFVGGCVRDSLLGVEANDFDILARGLPQDELNEALTSFGKVDVTGAVFGVTRFRPNDKSIPMLEISLPREEVSVGEGHKDFQVTFDHTLSLEADLFRRDFTVNSFAERVSTGDISSVPRAKEDLERGIIRFISSDSAHDDPLRILRAIRFISKLGFEVSPDTDRQLREAVPLLVHVSSERLQDELLKLIVGKHVAKSLRYAQEIGVWKVIIPELKDCVGVTQNHYHSLTVFEHIVEVVQHTPSTDPYVKLAALFHDIAKPPTKWTGIDGVNHFYDPEPGQKFLIPPKIPGNHEVVGADMAREIMNRLRFSTHNVDRVSKLVEQHMYIQGTNLRKQAARKLLKNFAHTPGDLRENIKALHAIRVGDIYGGKVNQDYLDMNAEFLEVLLEEIDKESAFRVTDLNIDGHELNSKDKLLDLVRDRVGAA